MLLVVMGVDVFGLVVDIQINVGDGCEWVVVFKVFMMLVFLMVVLSIVMSVMSFI